MTGTPVTTVFLSAQDGIGGELCPVARREHALSTGYGRVISFTDIISESIMRSRFLGKDLSHQPEHLVLVDILRGVAALTIVIYHFKNFFRGTAETRLTPQNLYETPLFSRLEILTSHGSAAVMLFWMISGLVMVLVYGSASSNRSGHTYLINRVSRLYPLHFLTLLLVAALQAFSLWQFGGPQIYENNDLSHFIAQVFFVSGIVYDGGLSFNGPIWSVSVEVFAYAAFFLYIRLTPVSLRSLAAMTILSAALFVVTGHITMLCTTYFFAGGVVYALRSHVLQRPGLLNALLVLSGAAFVAQCLALPFTHQKLPLTLVLIPLFGSALFVAAGVDRGAVRQTFAPLGWIGDITYSSYLLHTPIQITFLICVAFGLVELSVVMTPLFAASYLLAVLLLSRASYIWVERPVQAWTRKTLKGWPSPTPRVGSARR